MSLNILLWTFLKKVSSLDIHAFSSLLFLNIVLIFVEKFFLWILIVI